VIAPGDAHESESDLSVWIVIASDPKAARAGVDANTKPTMIIATPTRRTNGFFISYSSLSR